ncbi:protein serine/threonine kinase, putative [Entamoeba invadens IP1]|uniref:Protein serine/threonine kinase, putative n=1 Tax=Entamoeba invadens IP1 TaxID=370355 RepID=A0A0A1U721_ENTIV|nr:protein serine/threonine kinase, putative [Entamoeba invadens IP1]ELP88791.1 protein serine/threonine kinase, putative [Entamoeba invadens IP1]|eukprot:XP_004255562.1 protein serine/threonine kinase, putative [Entamoeba invadens IP1]
MMMINMTFTKGIGTPTSMAPEMLKKDKYVKSSDMYSFAVTMFEVFGWKEAYPINTFKFPWKIAEFVIAGKRPNGDNILELLFNIIKTCWNQKPKERKTVENVVDSLQNYYEKL